MHGAVVSQRTLNPVELGSEGEPESGAALTLAAGARSGVEKTGGERVRRSALRHAMMLATTAWLFGAVWQAVTTGVPTTAFAKTLGASQFQFGLLAALPFLASLLSLPASFLIEATGQRKRIFLIGLYGQRLLWIPIALLPLWLVRQHGMGASDLAMGVFLALMFVMHTGQAVGGPAWVPWMADLIPERSRGRYFSRRRQWGVLTAVPAAFVAGWLLDRYTGHGNPIGALTWVAGLFIVAALFGVMDIVCFNVIPDVPKAPQKGTQLLKALREPLRDKRFLWFAGFVGTMMFATGFMNQFVTLYVLDQGGEGGAKLAGWVNRTTQMMVIITPAVAQLMLLGLWGRTADRMGNKPLLVICAASLFPVGLAWVLMTPGNLYLGYVLMALHGAFWCGVEVANLNFVMDFSSTKEGHESGGKASGGSAYFAVNSVIVNIAGCAGGLMAGGVAQGLKDWSVVTSFKTFVSYDVLFVISALLRLVAVVVFLPHIHEHAARPTRQAMRFIADSAGKSIGGMARGAMRVLRIGRDTPPRKAA